MIGRSPFTRPDRRPRATLYVAKRELALAPSECWIVGGALVGLGDVRETEAITRWSADDLRPWARSSPRHQDLREGPVSEALLLDDVELQVLIEIGEWAAALTDRDRDRRKVVFIDETETGD